MKIIKGISINNLAAIGHLHVLEKKDIAPVKSHIDDIDAEIELFDNAVSEAVGQIEYICSETEKNDINTLSIIESQLMILKDEEYLKTVRKYIESERVSGSFAVYKVSETYESFFSKLSDEYVRERAADIHDISHRLVKILSKGEDAEPDNLEDSILVAEELLPSEIIKYSKNKIRGFVTRKGSMVSHTSILANTMNIPALVIQNLCFSDIKDGDIAVIDGYQGHLILNPTEDCVKEIRELICKREREDEELLKYINLPSETQNGVRIKVCANIGSEEDSDDAIEHGADGIGLFRSEFLFVGQSQPPSEEKQFEIYKKIVEQFEGKAVKIRTLDIDSEKMLPYVSLPKEENPALGLRGIRACFANPDLFKTQLKALFRAAFYGNIQILYPMIISENEIDEIYSIVDEAEQELIENSTEYKIPKMGIMIETPAAALISKSLASKADFFSIGTNDLTQYTLALGRQNTGLEKYYDSHHPAVLKMIKMIADNAIEAGIPVSICGDLSEDITLTELFVNMGIDELSVPPASVLRVRRAVRSIK